jgi:hypothetical protein
MPTIKQEAPEAEHQLGYDLPVSLVSSISASAFPRLEDKLSKIRL